MNENPYSQLEEMDYLEREEILKEGNTEEEAQTETDPDHDYDTIPF